MTTHCKWALSQNVFSHVYRLKVRCKNFTIHAASALKKRKGYRVYVCVFETFLQRADWVWSICGVWEMLLSLRQQMRQMERKVMKKEEEKKRKKLRYDGDHWNSPNNSLLKMNVYLFCQLYCKCKDIFWYSCTQISIHPSVPFSKASISIEWYITTEDSWEHFTLLKWFKSHEHKLIGAFHY